MFKKESRLLALTFLNKNECKEINNLILKMRSKYMIAEYNINENGSNIIGFSCPKMFEKWQSNLLKWRRR